MQKITFIEEKDTKNTIRFAEEGDAPIIGTLYVQKLGLKALGWEKGKSLVVTVEAGE